MPKLDPGVGQAEEEQDHLDRGLQAVLDAVEQVRLMRLLFGEEAEFDVRMRDRRDDRQEAERGMDARLLEAVPAQAPGEDIRPEAQLNLDVALRTQ